MWVYAGGCAIILYVCVWGRLCAIIVVNTAHSWSSRLRRVLALCYWPIWTVCRFSASSLDYSWSTASSSPVPSFNSDLRHYSCRKILMVIGPLPRKILCDSLCLWSCGRCDPWLRSSTQTQRYKEYRRIIEIVFPNFSKHNVELFQSVVGYFSCCANIVSPLFFYPSYPRAKAWCDLLHILREPKRINTQIHLDYHLLCGSLSLSLSFSLCPPSDKWQLHPEVTFGQGQIVQQEHTHTQADTAAGLDSIWGAG